MNFFCCYHPPSQSDQYFFENTVKTLDQYSKHYDEFMLAGDFNAEGSGSCLSQFIHEDNAKEAYIYCKYFDQTKFENNLNEKLSEGISNYKSFETTFIQVLKEHVPLKNKFLRANHATYITKTIMRRSQLETQTDLKPYKKHKNFCNMLYKRERRKHYEMKNVLDSKEFWKTMRPFLSDKSTVFC